MPIALPIAFEGNIISIKPDARDQCFYCNISSIANVHTRKTTYNSTRFQKIIAAGLCSWTGWVHSVPDRS